MVDVLSASDLDSPEALVRRVFDGEEAAFARIVRLHRAAMVRVAFVITGDVDRAAEAVAAAWPVAWGRLGRLRDPSRLGPWLCAIAASHSREVVGRRSRVAGEVSPALSSPGDPRPGGGRRGADPDLARRLARLTVEDRVLLALRLVAGLTAEELGRATRLAPATAIARCGRLAEQLEGGPTGDVNARPDATWRLERRLHAYADVPISRVDIDAVARGARLMRNDQRNRIVSLVLAVILAALVIAVPYLGEWRTGPSTLPASPTGAPAPAIEAESPPPGPGS